MARMFANTNYLTIFRTKQGLDTLIGKDTKLVANRSSESARLEGDYIEF